MTATDGRISRSRSSKSKSDIDIQRLCTAIVRDRKDLEPFRRNRRAAVVQLAGRHYSDEGFPQEVPVNLIGLYVDIMGQSLVANNPRVMLSTFDRVQTAAVDAMEKWANDELARLCVVESFQRAIVDSLFCVGIAKVGLALPTDEGPEVQRWEPYIDTIDLDDFVCDMNARRFDQCTYIGHRVRVEVAKANELLERWNRDEEFLPDERDDYNQGGDTRIDTLTRAGGFRDEFLDHCDLWEIYIPEQKRILVLRDEGGVPAANRKPVRDDPWIGPSCGPYHFLEMGVVPGNLMPKAPIMDLIDLHWHYNAAYRKLLRQTKDYKKLLPYRGGQAEEIERLKNQPDGGMFQCDNAETIKEIETGGPANAVLVMSDHMRQMFDFVGGNLALIGGRSAQTRTATQDKMLNENASAGVASKQDKAATFVQRVMEAWNWYAWYHPSKIMRSHWSSPADPNYKLARFTTPKQRKGPPPIIKVDPYSLPRQTPQTRLAFINQVIQTIQPFLAALQQDGIAIDGNALLGVFAKYGDEPDLQKIFHYSEAAAAPGEQGQQPGMPANTSRTYERISSGGQSQAAQQNDLSQNINRMEGPVNPNQGAA